MEYDWDWGSEGGTMGPKPCVCGRPLLAATSEAKGCDSRRCRDVMERVRIRAGSMTLSNALLLPGRMRWRSGLAEAGPESLWEKQRVDVPSAGSEPRRAPLSGGIASRSPESELSLEGLRAEECVEVVGELGDS
jgi:hypothetical protein